LKFLVDNALSPRVAAGMTAAGHDALHVRDLGLATEADSVIFDRAAAEDRVVVSEDADFGALIAVRDASKPSVVLFRRLRDRSSEAVLLLLLANLPHIERDL
jgi:predicted nuclease of predicted toxin-antitoxin system